MEPQLAEALAPFASPSDLASVLAALAERGWLERGATSGSWSLTEAGRRQHAAVLQAQQQVRAALTRGISAEEYAQTLDVLERMVNNLREATNEA